jgi:hypothetical protein
MSLSETQLKLLQEFERGLDPQHPEHSRIPARILGYGEISTVFAIQAEGLEGLAFKRLPLFRRMEEVDRYQVTLDEYVRLLTEEAGLRLPHHEHAAFLRPFGKPVFYIVQAQLPAQSIGHKALHHLPSQGVRDLVWQVLRELRKVWEFNRRQERVRIGIDGQVSNWSIEGLDPDNPRIAGLPLSYLDTSTPLFRVGGAEQVDPELFLRSAPSFLVWILRLLFLKDVVDRYYDFHLVAVDLAANFYKEQRPELVAGAVGWINEFFRGEAAELGIAPLSENEVRSYYRQDALIWRLYLSMRKVDRTLHLRLLRREYPYILPGRIQR